MRNIDDWAATFRHSHSSFPDDLRDEIDRHNERIVGLIRAEAFKAGQEAMRERAAKHLDENCDIESWQQLIDNIRAMPIEKPATS